MPKRANGLPLMSDALFPAGLVIDQCESDLDRLRDFAKAWNHDYAVRDHRNFTARFLLAHSLHAQLGIIQYGAGYGIHGITPPGALTIVIPYPETHLGVCGGRAVEPRGVILSNGEREFEYRLEAATRHVTIVLDRPLAESTLPEMLTAARSGPGAVLKLSDDETHRNAIRFAESLMQRARRDPDILRRTPDRFARDLAALLAEISYETAAQRNGIRRFAAARKAMEIIRHARDQELNIAQLCAYAGVPKRTLFQGFCELYGLTPMQYLRLLRLADVRRDLLASGRAASITEIALDHGFSHLGRFSAEYRAVYGELPAQTRSGSSPRGEARPF